MTLFRYKALTAAGSTISGTVEAPSSTAAIQTLRALGHYPLSAAATDGRATLYHWRQRLMPAKRISPRHLGLISHELATLLHAGVTLEQALQMLAGLDEIRHLREPLSKILARVRGGTTLSDALRADDRFPPLYVGLVRAGEMGGNLEATLQQLGTYLAKSASLRDALTSALIYPALLMVMASLSIGTILIFVLPRFATIFHDAGKSPPAAAALLMGLGDFLSVYWSVLLGAATASLLIARRALRRPDVKLACDGFLLRLPVLGTLLTRIQAERFSRTLGTLLTNGVPLPEALSASKDTITNSAVAAAIGTAATKLREGERLAARLAKTKLFPGILIDFVRVGEESGNLDKMLLRHADLAEQTITHSIGRLLAALNPALTLVFGGIVASIIATMLTALLSINDLALG